MHLNITKQIERLFKHNQRTKKCEEKQHHINRS